MAMNNMYGGLNAASQMGGAQFGGSMSPFGNINASFSGNSMMGQQSPMSYGAQGSAVPWGGSYYDPMVERARVMAFQPMTGASMTGMGAGWNTARQAEADMLKSMMQPQGGIDMNNIMGMMKGMMGGMGGMQGFDKIYDQASSKLTESMAPQQQDAKNALRDQMIAQGGEGALSSGQYQSAMGQLDERLAANQSGMLGQLYSSLYGPWQGAQAQMMTAPFTAMASLLSALSGFAR